MEKLAREQEIITNLKKLSKGHKKEVVNFIAYLRAKEELDATREILSEADFLQSILKGDEDFKTGRFKKWSEVRENV